MNKGFGKSNKKDVRQECQKYDKYVRRQVKEKEAELASMFEEVRNNLKDYAKYDELCVYVRNENNNDNSWLISVQRLKYVTKTFSVGISGIVKEQIKQLQKEQDLDDIFWIHLDTKYENNKFHIVPRVVLITNEKLATLAKYVKAKGFDN